MPKRQPSWNDQIPRKTQTIKKARQWGQQDGPADQSVCCASLMIRLLSSESTGEGENWLQKVVFCPLHIVVVWIRMGPRGSHIWMLCHWGVELFERIKRCGPDGGSVSLEVSFEVLKVHVRYSLSVCLCFSVSLLPPDQDVKLSATAPELFVLPCSLPWW